MPNFLELRPPPCYYLFIAQSRLHDCQSCSTHKASDRTKRAPMALRVYQVPLASSCQSWFRSNQKQTQCSCVRWTRITAPSVSRRPSLHSPLPFPIRALTICSETSSLNQILVCGC